MNKVSSEVGKKVDFGLITTLKVKDCMSGSHDPASILRVMATREKSGLSDKLWINQSLHAKCYFFDDETSIMGSLNFTRGGWVKNVELAYILPAKKTQSLIETVKSDILSSSREMSISSLRSWIEDADLDQIPKDDNDDKARLDQLQEELDDKYKLTKAKFDDFLNLDAFISWLRKNRNLLGAKTILSQHDNSEGQNRQGHVSQCFYGSVLFFKKNPDTMQNFADNLKIQTNPDMPKMPNDLKRKWAKFLTSNRNIRNHQFDMSVTYNVLPDGWGGCLYGGGGASGSIRRLLPLVAHWISLKS